MKNISKIFIILFLVSAVTGCASSNKDPQTITVWHWMSDREDAFIELADRYKQQTGVSVSFTLFAPSEAYAQRVKASVQTGTLPDIYGVLGEKRDFSSFIQSGFIADLTSDLERKDEANPTPWKDRFFEKVLAVNQFEDKNPYNTKPGTYGIPLDSTTIQMVYNKKLYREAGLDPEKPPKTWDDFIKDCRVLRDRGIPRFVSGFGEIWMIDALASNLAMNIMGERKLFQTYEGKMSYTDPDWVRVLYLFKQITDEKILVDGAVTMVNKTAEQTFANERAAFAFSGSWCVNVYKGMNPKLEYGALLPPAVTDAHPTRVWGGAGGSFVVNDRTPRKTEAIRFLKWLTEDASNPIWPK